jgi:hypothetical protein
MNAMYVMALVLFSQNVIVMDMNTIVLKFAVVLLLLMNVEPVMEMVFQKHTVIVSVM